MGLLMACSLLSLPNSPPLVSYQGQLSSAQFGLVSCSEGDVLGDTRPGEVGKGVDDGEEADHCELRGSVLFNSLYVHRPPVGVHDINTSSTPTPFPFIKSCVL